MAVYVILVLGKAVEPPAKKTKIEANGTSYITEACPTTNGSHTNEPVAAGKLYELKHYAFLKHIEDALAYT